MLELLQGCRIYLRLMAGCFKVDIDVTVAVVGTVRVFGLGFGLGQLIVRVDG